MTKNTRNIIYNLAKKKIKYCFLWIKKQRMYKMKMSNKKK